MASNLFKTSGFGLLLALILLFLFLQRPVAGQPADNITINGADGSKAIGLTNDDKLNGVLATVADRPAVQFSDLLRNFLLAAPPTLLQTQLDGVSPRISVQFSAAQRQFTLAYPAGKLNDTTPPILGTIGKTVGNAGSSITLNWSTNEFAKSTVAYGAQSGVYGQSMSEAEYTRDHRVVLNGLTSTATYYYIITSIDRDGNSGTSNEAQFTTIVERKLYLPLVSR